MSADAATTKTCSRCARVRSTDDFHRRRASRDGIQPFCKDCARNRARSYRARYAKTNGATGAAIRAATTTKRCRVCERGLPSAEFRLARSKRDGLADECRACFSEIGREKHAARTTVERRARCLAQFGLTPESYDALLAEQRGLCAICRTSEPGGRWNSRFAVDHDHATGLVRGLLCSHCNVMLGNAKDDPVRLRAAAAYLEEGASHG